MTLKSSPLSFTVNGKPVGPIDVPDDMMLLEVLHEYLGLTGSRMACGQGICHACAVILDGPANGAEGPREIRSCQYVYRLTAERLHPALAGAGAELATRDDEDEVLRVSAAMHLEEMGEDPLTVDPAGYRRRVRVLIDRGWTFVHRGRDGRIAYKMDIGCAGLTTAQIQGVYTLPRLRRRGVATAGMAACCALAFRFYPVLSLYVNDFNRPAVALYERVGFERMEYDFQTVLLS